MSAPKLSTHFAFASSLLLRSLAEDFEKTRDMKTLVRLLMAVSEADTAHPTTAVIEFLKETADLRIDPDWEAYRNKHTVDISAPNMPF